ncbi:MAG TPA: tetratricopeptide repeat protein [Terriglobales bacterium]|nr:tetratricopeptide repeat protein [Terriglobales bacterium]
MNRAIRVAVLTLVLVPLAFGQIDRIVIPAGTPEDQSLTAISNEPDAQKKMAAYQDFVQKFSSNPAAVAYGNWQIAQAYQTTGDLGKALEYGDKALAGSPHNLDILVSQTNLAQQMKNGAKILEYAAKGGEAYQGIGKEPKPDGMSEQDFAGHVEQDKVSGKNSYEFLEAAAFNAIADEKDPKARMSFIEKFSTAFPGSRFEEQIAQYVMYTLGPGQLNDPARLVSYGESAVAKDPNNLPALLLLANTYVEQTKPAAVNKAMTYAEKVVELAKADAPDADRSRKLSAGVAQSTLGYALMKQDKTLAAVPHLKTASGLLKGQDDVAYATALYRLGYAYAKLNKVTEARETLNEAVKIPGPLQQPSQDLLTKVNAARSKTR